MTLSISSGYNRMTVSTNSKNFENLYNEIEDAIKTVYSDEIRAAHNALQITDGTSRILIGKGINGGRVIEWYNPNEKTGGRISDYLRFTEGAWWGIVNFIIHHFIGTSGDLEALNAAEEEAEREEIANTVASEAVTLSDEAKRLYYEARTISEKLGTYLHYTDDPDAEHEPVVNLAMEMREKLYQIKRLREEFLDRADDLTGCNCVMEDFMGCDDMTVDGFDLKYDDPDDVFDSLWRFAWECFDGDPRSCDLYHEILYGFAA